MTKNRFRQAAGQGLLCLALIGLSGLLPACNDDMPAASYYTFTGETMADFLQRREDFSLFRRIVERAGRMDFMGSRGARTFFPATNAGVETFLQEKGYSSVEDIPEAYCDTLVRTSIVERIISPMTCRQHRRKTTNSTCRSSLRPRATRWMRSRWH